MYPQAYGQNPQAQYQGYHQGASTTAAGYDQYSQAALYQQQLQYQYQQQGYDEATAATMAAAAQQGHSQMYGGTEAMGQAHSAQAGNYGYDYQQAAVQQQQQQPHFIGQSAPPAAPSYTSPYASSGGPGRGTPHHQQQQQQQQYGRHTPGPHSSQRPLPPSQPPQPSSALFSKRPRGPPMGPGSPSGGMGSGGRGGGGFGGYAMREPMRGGPRAPGFPFNRRAPLPPAVAKLSEAREKLRAVWKKVCEAETITVEGEENGKDGEQEEGAGENKDTDEPMGGQGEGKGDTAGDGDGNVKPGEGGKEKETQTKTALEAPIDVVNLVEKLSTGGETLGCTDEERGDLVATILCAPLPLERDCPWLKGASSAEKVMDLCAEDMKAKAAAREIGDKMFKFLGALVAGSVISGAVGGPGGGKEAAIVVLRRSALLDSELDEQKEEEEKGKFEVLQTVAREAWGAVQKDEQFSSSRASHLILDSARIALSAFRAANVDKAGSVDKFCAEMEDLSNCGWVRTAGFEVARSLQTFTPGSSLEVVLPPEEGGGDPVRQTCRRFLWGLGRRW